jgi:flagellar biosynthesis component FlhA
LKTLSNLYQTNFEFQENFNSQNYIKLHDRIKPQYNSLFENLGRSQTGVKTLVKIRQDLIETQSI